MSLIYPGSFSKLLILGFSLVIIPFVLALSDAYLSIERLTGESERVIEQSVNITKNSRVLNENITSLERIAKQQLILNDKRARANYKIARKKFLYTVLQLFHFVSDEEIRAVLYEIKRQENEVWLLLNGDKLTFADHARLFMHFENISSSVRRINRYTNQFTEIQAGRMKYQTIVERQKIIRNLSMLVPVSFCLVICAISFVRRPIRQVSAAIRNLGEGHLDQAIVVKGPKDLAVLGRQMDWLRGRLLRSNIQQTRFLCHVSHELKTPLTALYEGAQLLRDEIVGRLNQGQREVVDIMQTNISRTRKLIEDLLDFSRMRFQPLVINRERISMADVYQRILDDQRLALIAKQLNLDCQGKDLVLNVDYEKIVTVLNNLLSNAIKFSPVNSVIQLNVYRLKKQTVIDVIDNGPGILPEDADRMFEPFEQGLVSNSSAIKGTGLGLSIAKELVNAHGGEINLLQHTPRGTCVHICLP